MSGIGSLASRARRAASSSPERSRSIFWRAVTVLLLVVAWLPIAGVLQDTWESPDPGLADYSPCPGAPSAEQLAAEQLAAEPHTLTCSPCNRVELYNHNLAVAGKRGSNAGFEGSGLGCVPVCVWRNDGDTAVEPHEVMFSPAIPDGVVISSSPAQIYSGRHFGGQFLFQTSRVVFSDEAGGFKVALASSDPEAMPSEVWLTPDQQSCQVYDARGHIVGN